MTVNLDADVAVRLTDLAGRRGTSVRDLAMALLRSGLSSMERSPRGPRRFRVRTFRSAFRPGVDPERLNRLADDLDGPLTRKGLRE